MLHWLFTFSRFAIAPFVFLAIKSSNFLSLYLLGYAILSDFLDGYFARLLGQTSIIGAILDGFADKFLIYFSLLGLIVKNHSMNGVWILTSIWLARDLILTVLWLLGKNSFQSIYFGKIYTALQFFTIAVLLASDLFGYKIPKYCTNFLIFTFFLLGAITIKKYYKYLMCH